jgi:hypothetical protein
MATSLAKACKHKIDILVALAGITLHILESNHGDLQGFRNSNSSSIKRAVAEVWDGHGRGLEYLPYQGDLFCFCETEEEHRLEGIEKVAVGLVKRANIKTLIGMSCNFFFFFFLANGLEGQDKVRSWLRSCWLF